MATSSGPRSVPNVTLQATRGAASGGGGDLPDSSLYQLQAGQYEPSEWPLAWCNPNGEEGTRSAFLYSHSQFDYVRDITVHGGAPPYHFWLSEEDAAVNLTKKAPAWNPNLYLWAELVIDHTQFASGSKVITLNCVDQEGATLSLALTVTVNDSKFVFMDGTNGTAGGAGTIGDSIDSLASIYTTSAADATHKDKIIVGRAGTYLIDQFDSGNDNLEWNTNKPVGWIPYPGEALKFNSSADLVVGTASGFNEDFYFGEAEYIGNSTDTANAKIFALFGGHDRIVIKPTFTDTDTGTSFDDNPGGVVAFASTEGHSHISLVNPTGNGMKYKSALFDFYKTYDSCVVGGGMFNCDPTSGAFCKSLNNRVMVAGLDAWDNLDAQNLLDGQNSNTTGSPVDTVIQYIGCKAYRPSETEFGGNSVRIGSLNNPFGRVVMSRITFAGGVTTNGSNGTPILNSSVAVNDRDPVIRTDITTDGNNQTFARADIGTVLDADGNVLDTADFYGTAGANYAAPEAT